MKDIAPQSEAIAANFGALRPGGPSKGVLPLHYSFWLFRSSVAFCAKACWDPKPRHSPKQARHPYFLGIPTDFLLSACHTKPHSIPLSSPLIFSNFPEFAQIPPVPWNFWEIRRGEQFTQSWLLILDPTPLPPNLRNRSSVFFSCGRADSLNIGFPGPSSFSYIFLGNWQES